MVEPTPIAEPLDNFLREVVQTLHAAVNQGMQHVEDDPAATEKIVKDCEDMLDVIMAGRVDEWIG